jgi:hypothetical protein
MLGTIEEMKRVFSEYIQIHHKGLTRNLRNAKIRELLESQDLSGIEIEELVEFEKELEKLQLSFSSSFFEKVFFPRLEQGFQADEPDSIKLLLKHIQIVYQVERKRETSVYSKFALIDKGLKVCPTDRQLLKTKEQSLTSYLGFTIHEVPSGVLYGMNGSSATECLALLATLGEYKQLCDSLEVDRKELITECEFHYQHYYTYLQHLQEYQSYEEYLNKNCS